MLHDIEIIGFRPISPHTQGVGPRVVSIAAFHATVRGSFPVRGGLKETQKFSSPFTRKTQYCGEHP